MYHEVLPILIRTKPEMNHIAYIHRLAGEGVGDLLKVEVPRAVRVLLEELTSAVAEELVVRNEELERTRVPLVVKVDIVGVDECQFLICSGR